LANTTVHASLTTVHASLICEANVRFYIVLSVRSEPFSEAPDCESDMTCQLF